jgi:hypothetical protein
MQVSKMSRNAGAALWVTTMYDQNVPCSAVTPPRCASCAQTMRLVKRVSRFDGLPDLAVFECRACGVSHIEAVRC